MTGSVAGGRLRWGVGLTALGLVLLTPLRAAAKPWKGAETISHQTFKYGAFEARIRAARGGGVITPFFLWKDGSERPGASWQEQDFEIFGRDGTYQTQVMTPGKAGDVRTEHTRRHTLPAPAWDYYYTYRMEWSEDRLAFYVDGRLVREETDPAEFAKLLDPSQAEAAQLRIGIWAGDWSWSGDFVPGDLPAAVFVNWVQTYAYTPGAGPNGSDFTPSWRDDFDGDSGRWWRANWTFEHAVNDYVPQNAAVRNGYLVMVLTDEASVGQFPVPPVDSGAVPSPVPVPEVVTLPARVEAEKYWDYFDTTPGNAGLASCSDTDVDAQRTGDTGGGCNVAYTRPGEWLEYEVDVARAATFDLVLRVATDAPGRSLHVEIDGVDVSGSLEAPVSSWQVFRDVRVPELPLSAGAHVVRVVFETGYLNLNYLEFEQVGGELPSECTPISRRVEAEAMSVSTGGSAPGGWNLWSNGTASTQHTFAGGETVLRVLAYGQAALGVAPHMAVRVGDRTLGDASATASVYTPHEFSFDASPGAQTISVVFDNDYYANGQDRNLYLDAVVIEECVED